MATPAIDMGPDVSKGHVYLIPCCILGTIALGLCIARIRTRLHLGRLFADDYIIVVAVVSAPQCGHSFTPVHDIDIFLGTFDVRDNSRHHFRGVRMGT